MGAVWGILPIALIALACPLMMLLMMRGMHGGHAGHSGHQEHAPDHRGGNTPSAEERVQLLEEEVERLRRQVDAVRSSEAPPSLDGERITPPTARRA